MRRRGAPIRVRTGSSFGRVTCRPKKRGWAQNRRCFTDLDSWSVGAESAHHGSLTRPWGARQGGGRVPPLAWTAETRCVSPPAEVERKGAVQRWGRAVSRGPEARTVAEPSSGALSGACGLGSARQGWEAELDHRRSRHPEGGAGRFSLGGGWAKPKRALGPPGESMGAARAAFPRRFIRRC